MQLSVCIIVKNEEKNLERCLKCLLRYQFEIVVVDTGSSDLTKQVAQKYTEHVYEFKWCDDFSAAKNYAVSKANHEYILSIDSDEYLCELELAELVQKIVKNPHGLGRVTRVNQIYQNGMDLLAQEYISRVFSKKEYYFEGKIHEQLVRFDKTLPKTYHAPIKLEHGGYYLSDTERKIKAQRNIRLLENEIKQKGKEPYLLYQLGKSYAFMQNYEKACEYFGEALSFDLDPRLEFVIDMVDAYGYALINAGRNQDALAFENIQKEFGSTSDFQFLMGLIYMNNEMFDEAVNSFFHAAELKKAKVVGVDSYLAFYNIGVVYECLNHVDKSMEFYRKCGEYLPAIKRIGNYYEKKNPRQAYLFYREWRYRSKNNGAEQLLILEKEIKERYKVSIPKTSIIILSYHTLEETQACIASIRKNCNSEDYEIVVVDNASTDGSIPWLKKQKDIRLHINQKNEGFPRGCNQGIALSEAENDIWLLNSDTLVPPGALFWLKMGLQESSEVAAAGSVSNYCPNYQNIEKDQLSSDQYMEYAADHAVSITNPYERKLWLVGFSLLIKSTVLRKIGLLDECFSPGNYEDTDYGFRLAKAGYQQLLCKNSFVYHYGSRSFGKNKEVHKLLLDRNEQKFIDKWGIHPYLYSYIKTWEVDQIKEEPDKKISVMDVGCGMGATLARVRYLYPNSEILGVEINSKAAELAHSITSVINEDVCQMEDMICKIFDYILTGGIWEHTEDVSKVLTRLKGCLKKDGILTGSIYNRQHPKRLAEIEVQGRQFTGAVGRENKNGFTAEEWIEVLNQNGIAIDEFSFKKDSPSSVYKEPYQYFWKGHSND